MNVPVRPRPVSPSAKTLAGALPEHLRAAFRTSELGLIFIAATIGVLSGIGVLSIGATVQLIHETLFGLSPGQRLSGATGLQVWTILSMPILGGLLMGLIGLALVRWRPKPLVDPIEANALHGGRLSLRDGFIVVVQNIVSSGFGASVGVEAGYTQISAAFASRIGLAFQLRRADLRMLVGCGAAAAIAAAFNAPLTGAFYAFELIIGTYSIATLAPVVIAALCGALLSRAVSGDIALLDVGAAMPVVSYDYPAALALGALCAGVGIAIMQSVTYFEMAARRTLIPSAARPAIGGLLVGGLAILSPQILASGHGALHVDITATTTIAALLSLFALKALAAAISIGSGFRGGLFFASLFMGALLGKAFAQAVGHWHIMILPDATYAVIGMSALAVTIVGGPMTMTFLALELTGDFPITMLVLIAVMASSIIVRKTFGYSFATWRFHLRGETIRSAQDIGWMRNLTVGKLMRPDVKTISDDTRVSAFRRDFPLGSTQRVVVVDASDRYAGIMLVQEAHGDQTVKEGQNSLRDMTDNASLRVRDLLRFSDTMLLPAQTARDAMQIFEKAEVEALAVVDGLDTRRVIGLLTESHVLRRYSEELDLRRGESLGER